MLSLEVALLTGRYIATAFDDRGRAEWPPHPARLFSALVAAHFEAAEPSNEERAALTWLEEQGAPEITASDASERDVVTVYVPVNDTSVVGSLDDEAALLAEARAEVDLARAKGDKARAAAQKKLDKAEGRWRERVRKATEPVPQGKEKGGPVKTAASLLPEQRERQPRTFPSVTPHDARIVFTWPDAKPSAEQRAALDGLTARVVRLGHSSSLVSVRVGDERPAATWVPDGTGHSLSGDTTLRIAGSGQLEMLCQSFELQADTPGRVMPATFQRYVRPGTAALSAAHQSSFGTDWIVLRRIDGPRLASTRVVDVTRTFRKALLQSFGDNAPEILSGHRSPGAPSHKTHAAYVTLPFVGREHADGSILGVAIVLPREATSEERFAVYRALDNWERRARQDEEDFPRLGIHLGRAGELGVMRFDGGAPLMNLRPKTWCEPSKLWASVTPIALDRNPGDLRSRDPKKEAAAYAEAEETVALACERIGLPRPARVTVLPAAPIVGAAKARQFLPFHTGSPPMQRVLVHAALTFDAAVEGPILLGAGRYFGLGLFRPLRDHD